VQFSKAADGPVFYGHIAIAKYGIMRAELAAAHRSDKGCNDYAVDDGLPDHVFVFFMKT
jgi:hypothetical protein